MLQYSARKTQFFCTQIHCIEFNVPRTNFNIKQLREKNGLLRTGPDQLYPRAFALRPNLVLFVLAIFKRVIDEKNACPPVVYISDLIRVSPHVFQLAEK